MYPYSNFFRSLTYSSTYLRTYLERIQDAYQNSNIPDAYISLIVALRLGC